MGANPGNEQWFIKENGGSGESVGIASTNSNWFIAENVLRDNAEMICRLWNEQAAPQDNNVEVLNSNTKSMPCQKCGKLIDESWLFCPQCGHEVW